MCFHIPARLSTNLIRWVWLTSITSSCDSHFGIFSKHLRGPIPPFKYASQSTTQCFSCHPFRSWISSSTSHPISAYFLSLGMSHRMSPFKQNLLSKWTAASTRIIRFPISFSSMQAKQNSMKRLKLRVLLGESRSLISSLQRLLRACSHRGIFW